MINKSRMKNLSAKIIKNLRKIGKKLNLSRQLKWYLLQVYKLCSHNQFFQTIFNFVSGLSLGFLLFSLIIFVLDLNQLNAYTQLINYLILLIFTVSYIVSRYQRALIWLLFVYLIIYAIPNLISFVVMVKFFKIFLITLIHNLSNLLYVISCSINLIWSNAVERADTRLKPVQEFMKSIKSIKEQTDRKFENMTNTEADLGRILMDFNEISISHLKVSAEKAQIDYKANLSGLIKFLDKSMTIEQTENYYNLSIAEKKEKQESIFACYKILFDSLKVCEQQTDIARAQCEDKFQVISYFVCKTADKKKICNNIIMRLSAQECSKIDQRSLNGTRIASFMKKLNLAKSLLKFNNLVVKNSNTKLDFSQSINENEKYSKVSIRMTEKLYEFFNQLQTFSKYLAIFFLSVSLYKSHKYLQTYLTDISFDNKFITNYFIHLDIKRKFKSKRNILPLNPLNKSLACELFDYRCLPFEEKLSPNYLTIISIFILILFAYFINNIFIVLLEEINKNFRVEIDYKSNFTFEYSITGYGFVAQKLRRIMKQFRNVSHKKISKYNTKICIKKPQQIDQNQLIFCFVMLFFYAFIKNLHYLISRFRSRFVSLFYPEIEKKRIIYLYNGMLKETSNMFRNSILNLYSKINGENENIEFSFNDMLLEFRNFLLNYFPKKTVYNLPFINCDYCKICEQHETKNNFASKIFFCKRCYLTYCFKCFSYLNQNCLNCDLPNLGYNYSKFDNKNRFL